jgi:hypothetical protein
VSASSSPKADIVRYVLDVSYAIKRSAAYIVATVLAPIIAPAGSRSVGDNCARCGANQPTCNGSTSRPAGQTTNKRATAATDQCAACDPIVHPTAARTPGEQKCQSNYDEGAAHLLLFELIIFRREPIAALKNRDLYSLSIM